MNEYTSEILSNLEFLIVISSRGLVVRALSYKCSEHTNRVFFFELFISDMVSFEMVNHCLTLNEVDAENRKLLSMSKGTQNYIKTTWIAILQRFIIIACSKQTLECMHKNDWRLFIDKNSFDFMDDRSTYEFHYFWTYAMYELISSYPRTIPVVISIHEPCSLIHVFQVYECIGFVSV